MKDETKFQNRYRISSNRLSGWDYNTEGAYFLTICTYVTKKINAIHNTPGEKVWQSNYHDHIIRNNQEYQRIADYIEMNPECWQSDALR